MKMVPYTAFSQTRMVPLRVYVNGKYDQDATEYEDTLWVERGEDWYGMRKRPTLVVQREDFIRGELIDCQRGCEKPGGGCCRSTEW